MHLPTPKHAASVTLAHSTLLDPVNTFFILLLQYSLKPLQIVFFLKSLSIQEQKILGALSEKTT